MINNRFNDYCPVCIHYDQDLGVCYMLHENVLEYPNRFLKKCNGKLFEKRNSIENKLNEEGINAINRYGINYPEWFNLLEADMRPDLTNIEKLEEVRKEFNIPHNDFAQFILGSPITTYKVQYDVLMDLKIKFPNYDERKLWSMVLESRNFTTRLAGLEEIAEENIQILIKNASSFEDIVNYIVSREFYHPMPHVLRKIYSSIVDAAGQNNLSLKPASLLLSIKDFIIDLLMILNRSRQ